MHLLQCNLAEESQTVASRMASY